MFGFVIEPLEYRLNAPICCSECVRFVKPAFAAVDVAALCECTLSTSVLITDFFSELI